MHYQLRENWTLTSEVECCDGVIQMLTLWTVNNTRPWFIHTLPCSPGSGYLHGGLRTYKVYSSLLICKLVCSRTEIISEAKVHRDIYAFHATAPWRLQPGSQQKAGETCRLEAYERYLHGCFSKYCNRLITGTGIWHIPEALRTIGVTIFTPSEELEECGCAAGTRMDKIM